MAILSRVLKGILGGDVRSLISVDLSEGVAQIIVDIICNTLHDISLSRP
jgi:molybdopterin-binding protein